MPQSNPLARIVLTTAADTEEADRLAHALVSERLAACVTLIPSARSVYRWKDEIETTSETLLLIKTAEAQVTALEIRLKALHSYETPEFLVLKVESGSPDYLAWLEANLMHP
ncbi:MAG TPA: divalent-cation tolerance protein CutA [Terracidiphilus sp.]|jgi:periplasmic divalent cation tolerance protein|nr:divalent-cation tolerance protein CutA [Terracidiphilus sp.]